MTSPLLSWEKNATVQSVQIKWKSNAFFLPVSSSMISLLIIFFGSLLFFPFLGAVHLFDWDEINFAECAREMIVTGNYSTPTIDFIPFHEKPPLFIWFQVLSMKMFGVNEFAARFPNAVCGIATLLILAHIGRKIKSIRLGLLWVLAYAGSFLPHFYFLSGIIDPWFNLFVFLGIYFFILRTHDERVPIRADTTVCTFLSALFIGLAILTKGPVALLIFILCSIIFWITNHFKKIISFTQLAVFAVTVFITGGSWYIYQMITDGTMVSDFIHYQFRLFSTEDSGHGGPIYYHFIVLLFGCFPASIIALGAFRKKSSDNSFESHFKKWMFVLFFVVLVLFSLVRTKIIHYSSLCYFPLTYLAAYSIENFISGEWKWKKWMSWLIGIIGITMGLIFIFPPVIDRVKEKIISSNVINDAFAEENLRANVHWSGFEMFPGIILIIGIIFTLVWFSRNDKRAFSFLFILCLVSLSAVSALIVPKVEQYSQGAAIEFYEQLQGKCCHVEPLKFKSYAHLFYSYKKPDCANYDANGNPHKLEYFVSKINDVKQIQKKYPQLTEIYRKNGFVFYVKKISENYFVSKPEK